MSIPAVSLAKGLPITPGLWEVTTTIESNMGSRTETQKDCIKETEFDPRRQMQDMPKDKCKVNVKVDGNTLNYDMVCTQPAGVKMTMRGSTTINGKHMQGSMNMEGGMGGFNISRKMKTSGKWLSGC